MAPIGWRISFDSGRLGAIFPPPPENVDSGLVVAVPPRPSRTKAYPDNMKEDNHGEA